jgi:hypothetical protein
MDAKEYESKWQLKTMEKWKYELISPYLHAKKKEKYDKIFRKK